MIPRSTPTERVWSVGPQFLVPDVVRQTCPRLITLTQLCPEPWPSLTPQHLADAAQNMANRWLSKCPHGLRGAAFKIHNQRLEDASRQEGRVARRLTPTWSPAPKNSVLGDNVCLWLAGTLLRDFLVKVTQLRASRTAPIWEAAPVLCG